MRLLRTALLAGLAAGALALAPGLARAGSPQIHVLTVQLPGGGVAQIRYSGDVAPRVVLLPDGSAMPMMAMPSAVFGNDSPFAMLERMSAEMDREAAAMFQAASSAFAMPMPPNPDRLMPAALGGAPFSGRSFSFIASIAGNGVCMRSVTITSVAGAQPRVVSDTSGNCGPVGHAVTPAQQQVTPTLRHDTLRVRYDMGPSAPTSRPRA